jgi:uncharacterized protein (DUF2267 family)
MKAARVFLHQGGTVTIFVAVHTCMPSNEFSPRGEAGPAPDDRLDAERIARAVFTVLAQRVSEGESEDVQYVLPAGRRELWP